MAANTMYCHSAVFDWGNMRGKGYYINHDGNGTGQRAFYLPGDYTTSQGSSVSINSSLPDGKLAGTITHTASHNHAFFINNSTTGVSGLYDYFYYKEFQVEANTHPTQYTAGTRSVSGSLLDLTNTSEVDVTDVNFDSNAQFIFEGSERANITYTSTDLDGNPEFTTEAVIKRTANLSNAGFWGIGGDVSLKGINGYTHPSHTNKIGIDLWGTATFHTGQDYPLNEYVHVIWVKEDGAFNTTNIKIYVNGVLYTGSDLTTVRGSSHTPNLNTSTSGKGLVIGRVGPQTNLYHASGEMPMFKVYTRALTAGEVKQNFAMYKKRFNI